MFTAGKNLQQKSIEILYRKYISRGVRSNQTLVIYSLFWDVAATYSYRLKTVNRKYNVSFFGFRIFLKIYTTLTRNTLQLPVLYLKY